LRAGGYTALSAKMASKNMMNHYQRPTRQFPLKTLLTHNLCQIAARGEATFNLCAWPDGLVSRVPAG
jgi:hypothetical protein